MTLLGDSYYYLSHFGHHFRHSCSLFTTLSLWEMNKETEARDSKLVYHSRKVGIWQS